MKQRCAICDCKAEPLDPLFDFPQLLREWGLEGKVAHARCMTIEREVRRSYKVRYGVEKSSHRGLFK